MPITGPLAAAALARDALRPLLGAARSAAGGGARERGCAATALASPRAGLERGRRGAERRVGGLRDPIVPAANLLRSAHAAQAAGLPIAIEEHADFGHTLLVTHTLPSVIDWLLGG